MASISVNIHKFLKAFNEEYDFLYNAPGEVAGEREAVEAFDEFAKHHKAFVCEFVRYRRDYVSSDREAAAFMFALSRFVNGGGYMA